MACLGCVQRHAKASKSLEILASNDWKLDMRWAIHNMQQASHEAIYSCVDKRWLARVQELDNHVLYAGVADESLYGPFSPIAANLP
jgi:hypothetical protein